MESAAGVTAVALFVLWLGYWAPQLIRHRTELAEARSGDRYSVGLRVVAVSGGAVFRTGPTEQRRGEAMTTGTGGSRLTGARPAPLVRVPEEVESPAQRRALAEQRARRAVRARRRFVLTLFLLVSSFAAWVAVAVVPLHWGVAAAPTALLVTALALGRRAAIGARRAEEAVESARRAARQRATQARALANGGPYAPRNRMRVAEPGQEVVPAAKKSRGVLDELLTAPEPERAKVVDETGAPAQEGASDDAEGAESPGVGGGAWDPVPVPLPTYVTKPAAPRLTARPAARGADGASKDGASKDGAGKDGAGKKDGAGSGGAGKGNTGKAGAARTGTAGHGEDRSDDASARLAAAMRASAGKPMRDGPGDQPVERARAGASGPGGESAPGPSSDTAMHPDEEELMRPAPRVPDETLAQPLEQILARRRAAG
ncbi:hypothetical protein [Myceligenerans indicum]|uniref:Uncharacterized protein n=1 Tax=Myceligenerans indicum TaxID=2593663 RepID=A0ABS1LQ55_9MICO|nr:hypothetical protein [Myceligenerans indicum]MBL0888442.1 hypothetical protein [Myceligenerans indicum]